MRSLQTPWRSVKDGTLASLGLFAFYFAVLRFANGSWSQAMSQFRELWFWITLLDLGFGIQVGLYSQLRRAAKNNLSTKITTASGGTSALGMVACCAHHLGDVLPIIGLSGTFFFLSQYQAWFIFLGLLSNLAGITYITKQLRKTSGGGLCP